MKVERRKAPRRRLDIMVRIVVIDQDTHEILDEGCARVYDISPVGLRITELDLPRGLPARPFRLGLIIEGDIFEGLRATCVVKRIFFNGGISLGLEFERIPEKERDKIYNFVLKEVQNG
jgi:hypothetical protein